MNGIDNLAVVREDFTVLLQAHASRENGNDPEDSEEVDLRVVALARMFAFGTEEEKEAILRMLGSQTKDYQEFQRLCEQLEFFAQKEMEDLRQTEQKDRNALIKEKNHLRQIKQILEDAEDNEKLLKELLDCVALIIGGMPIGEVCLRLKAKIRRIDFILSSMKEEHRE